MSSGTTVALGQTSTADAQHTFQKEILPFLKQYCTKCHGGSRPKEGVALDKFTDLKSARKKRVLWAKVAQNIRSGVMPPSKRKPPIEVIKKFATWIETEMAKVDCTIPDPGRVTIRRLNRTEYKNTIRDLVGLEYKPADDFPDDDIGYGFDNIGDVLSLSPLLFERYLKAANEIIDAAYQKPDLKKRLLIAPQERNLPKRARRIIGRFAFRAFRRPPAKEEIDRLMQLAKLAKDKGQSFEQSVQLAMKATLVSPYFLFRIEQDPPGNEPNAVRVISEFELATRLSYFLWSTMPDGELFRLAKENQLRKRLDAQLKRMIRDPKIQALTKNFAGQWLQFRNLYKASPDPKRFPTFNNQLRSAMIRETELFFETLIKEDRSVLEFLDADFTFVNETLARHYGIPNVTGPEFRRVPLSDGKRGGILTQASVLTVTSYPNRTSPVIRGKWILENILGTPPPPPPPDVPELEESAKESAGSLRKQLELHRKNAICASCHQRMDPLGFALENFDAIGKWRDRDGRFPIDANATLPSGRKFVGPAGLRKVLHAQADEFRSCLTEKMLTFALGRGLEYYDRCHVEKIAKAVAQNENRFTSLISAIVKSDPFQKRKGKGGKK